MHPRLTPDFAGRLAAIALGRVTRPWPYKLDQVLGGPGDLAEPRALHPIFSGSFDWHSCVHGHWLLASLLRLFPGSGEAPAIGALLDNQFTEDNVAGELAYVSRPLSGGFERPYGWAWLLKLQAELERHAARPWAEALRPLARAFAERLAAHLPKLTYPIRAGIHGASAFALGLALDYAEAAQDAALGDLIRIRLVDWFAGDAGLFAPAIVSDPADGKIAHLDGLNLS